MRVRQGLASNSSKIEIIDRAFHVLEPIIGALVQLRLQLGRLNRCIHVIVTTPLDVLRVPEGKTRSDEFLESTVDGAPISLENGREVVGPKRALLDKLPVDRELEIRQFVHALDDVPAGGLSAQYLLRLNHVAR